MVPRYPTKPWPLKTRWCNDCQSRRRIARFSFNRSAHDGYCTFCKDCMQRRRLLWANGVGRKKAQAYHHFYGLVWRANLTPEQRRLRNARHTAARRRRYHSDPEYRLRELARRARNKRRRSKE